MARSFNGSTQYVTRTHPVSAYGCSMAAWVKSSSFTSGRYFLQLANTGSATDRGGINLFTGGEAEATINAAGTARTWRTTAGLATDTWGHVAGVFTSGSSIAAYLNGVTTGSYSFSGTPGFGTWNNFSIGALRRSAVTYVACDVAEVAVWGATLTADEVTMLAAGYSPLFVRPQNLIVYAPLHGRGGAASDEEDWVSGVAFTHTASPAVVDHPRIIYPRRRTSIIVPSAASGAPTITALSARLITASSAQPRISYS